MSRSSWGIFAVVICLFLASCTSGLKKPGTITGNTGRASFSVRWPERSRLVPVASNSIVVQVNTGNEVLRSVTISRPATGGISTVVIDELPIGVVNVSATAYPNSDGTGVAQATASSTTTVQLGQTANIAMTMDSTIRRLVPIPGAVHLLPGRRFSLATSPRDVSDNVVLTSALVWSSSNSAIATVNPQGEVRAVAVGSTTVIARETESDISVSIPVTVTTGLIPKAVAYQLNLTHDGTTSFSQALQLPTSSVWSIDIGAIASYPLIADNKVFVTSTKSASQSDFGSYLHAFDLTTGTRVWGPISIPNSDSHWSGHCYENGKIFVANKEGDLFSFDAATGAPGWSVHLPDPADKLLFDAPPIVASGVIYLSGLRLSPLVNSGIFYAIDATTGQTIWTAPMTSAGGSSPTYANGGVFASYPCVAYKFHPSNGSTLWVNDQGCTSTHSETTAAYSNNVLHGANRIYNANTGATLGNLHSHFPKAVSASTVFVSFAGRLQAVNKANNQITWDISGDAAFVTPPVIVDQTVFVEDINAKVYALNSGNGQVLWSAQAGTGTYLSRMAHTPDMPKLGIGAGEGYLAVPADTKLTVWRLTP